MSIKLTNHLEGNFYQHKEFVLEQLTSSTGLPAVQGILYTNTSDKGFYYFDGTNWKRLDNQSMSASAILTALLTVDGAGTSLDADLLDGQEGSHYLNRTNHSGTQASSTISDLATTVKGYRLDEFAVPTADINLNNKKITNLANPASATSSDAAPASWVTTAINNAVQGLDIKGSVRAASTPTSGNVAYTRNANVCTVTTPFSLLDGVNVATVGTRILLKNQADAQQNAIYTVSAVSGANVTELTVVRSDMETIGGDINQNVFVFVEQGNTQADTGWVMSASQNAPMFLGTNITWHQFASAGVITAGTGLTKSGNEISIDTSVVARKFSATIGNGTNDTFTITHNLGTEDVYVSVREASGAKEFVLADVAVTGTNTVSVTFGDIPTSNQYRVTVIG